MAQDQNKKTLRSFQCRDYLWEIFEQMSEELECSVDYLVNEAMRQYARSRNYGVRSSSHQSLGMTPARSPSSPSIPAASAAVSARPGAIPSLAGPPARPSIPSAPPPSAPRASGPGYGAYQIPPAPAPQPPAPDYGNYAVPAPHAGAGYDQAPLPPVGAPPPRPMRQPAPQPPQPPMAPPQRSAPMPPQAVARPTLFVIFNGQKIPVSKDEFVIGRGTKTADLPIKDGNISRRHAAVVYHGGAFYMKDLGSTNGVDYQGKKVGTKRIDEGDVFQICDYELRFTYY